MNARTLPLVLRIGIAVATLCALQCAQAGQSILFPDGTVTLIRATTVYAVDAPVALEQGDLLATDAHVGAQIEDGDGTIVALGAHTRIAIDAAPQGAELALLSGWIKIARTHTNAPFSIDMPTLDATLLDGSVVLHASRDAAALFIETGSMTLALPEHADAHQPLASEHYAERAAGKPLDVRPRPAAPFIDAMPLPFRDALASATARTTAKPAAPAQGRTAAYADLADWLSAPLAIRRGFVARFRPLAQAEPFRSQVRRNLRTLAEWRRVLYPPPAIPRHRAVTPVQAKSAEVES